MANRSLKRIRLPPDCLTALEAKKMKVAKDVLEKNQLELTEILNINCGLVDEMIGLVSETICPSYKTALDMINSSHQRSCLGTGISALDACLQGGLTCGTITEIVGPAGVGKTQFCMQSCVRAVGEWEGHSAIYIDTESRFSAARLCEIAQSTLCHSEEKLRSIAERCIVVSVASTASLMNVLSGLEEVVIEKNVKLIVVDSVASLIRREYGSQSIPARQLQLGREAYILKRLAEDFKIPVVVTNQVTMKFNAGHRKTDEVVTSDMPARHDPDSYLTAALGTSWSHCVNTRLVLEQGLSTRVLTVAKSPLSPVVRMDYQIMEGGISVTSEVTAAEENFWEMKINPISSSELPPAEGDPCNQSSAFYDA